MDDYEQISAKVAEFSHAMLATMACMILCSAASISLVTWFPKEYGISRTWAVLPAVGCCCVYGVCRWLAMRKPESEGMDGLVAGCEGGMIGGVVLASIYFYLDLYP